MGKIVKYKMQLEVLTPVHIAGADYKSKLDKKEYVFDKKNERLIRIDNAKFTEYLIKKNLFDKYISYIEKNVNEKNQSQKNFIKLEDFLNLNRINIDEVEKFSKKIYKMKSDIGNLGDIKLLGRDIREKPYIQGSSIKGALINALLVDYIIIHRDEFENDKKKILLASSQTRGDNVNSLKDEVKKTVKKIAERILYNENSKLESLKNIGISVSDSYSYKDTSVNFYQDIDENIKKRVENKEYERKMPVVREYINKDSKFYFDITIDFDLLAKTNLRIKNIDDLISKLENATDYLLKNTLDLNIENQNLILGANTGFHQKTIVHALFDNKKERLEVIKKILHKGSKNAIGNHLNDKFSPRIINRIKINNKLELAGLVEIKKIEEKIVGGNINVGTN